jgi:hypothetical protein
VAISHKEVLMAANLRRSTNHLLITNQIKTTKTNILRRNVIIQSQNGVNHV